MCATSYLSINLGVVEGGGALGAPEARRVERTGRRLHPLGLEDLSGASRAPRFVALTRQDLDGARLLA